MTPTYCHFHRHWTDGECVSGKRSLNRNDLAIRISDITALLDDDEGSQSRGYYANRALRLERQFLEQLRSEPLL